MEKRGVTINIPETDSDPKDTSDYSDFMDSLASKVVKSASVKKPDNKEAK